MSNIPVISKFIPTKTPPIHIDGRNSISIIAKTSWIPPRKNPHFVEGKMFFT